MDRSCARFLAQQQTRPVVFYIATDQAGVRGLARKQLSVDGEVKWLQGRVTRATETGIKMALADMMLLEA